MKKILLFTFSIIMILGLAGCAKVISEENMCVDVKIVDVDYRHAYTVPMKIGNFMTVRTVPSDYDVYIEYMGKEYYIDSREAYDFAKDRIGEIVKANFVLRKYDDGTEMFFVENIVIENESKKGA